MDILTPALFCLTMAIYHEARSEPLVGQAAVAMVVMNRVESKDYPDKVCEVLKEEGQFTFNWVKPKDKKAWVQAYLIADSTLKGDIVDMTHGALHYHRDDIKLAWTDNMIPKRIGDRHIFWLAKDVL